jgi:hypothetical protein
VNIPFCPGQWAPRRHEAWCGEDEGRARKVDQGGYVMMTRALYGCHGYDGEGDGVSPKAENLSVINMLDYDSGNSRQHVHH